MSKLWQKSTTDTQSDTAKKVEAFTVGNDYELDQVLVPYDVQASKVHAGALKRAGILSEKELEQLLSGLDKVQLAWDQGEFKITIQDEDMHTAIENFLISIFGELGKKIHTGRSRNDQVLTAMRLYEKDALDKILSEVKSCAKLLIDLGEQHEQVPMPGYTHTRKAMLSSVGLWAGGYAELLIMQLESSGGIKSLINRSPLGTAAGFGTTFNIDREIEAEELGFAKPLICSTTAQLSRGWVELQFVQYLAGITAVLNRLAADIIQFSSEAYPYFDLDEVVCTGSSIMPQKKNPDVAELLRAGHSEITGAAASLQMLTVNLGSGYHRDLQLSKEPVIKSINKTLQMLEAAQLLIQAVRPDRDALEEACTHELFAAEAANELVREEGVSFRDAYRAVAENPELMSSLSFDKLFGQFRHTGSPGNSGLQVLKQSLQ
jgi:argininosuccinate lyase